ncbi:uncharacterized protein [Haliotis cracherodii]|uniref:uncharacterized protein n=1 Tax=Haliotis cracherodii TaxID=6455 RepID=UPI0039EA4AE6
MYQATVISLFLLVCVSLGKDCNQKFRGCKIDYSQRECLSGEAVGCKNPFPYSTLEECQKDFNGRLNICENLQPCENDGECLQVQSMDSDNQRQRGYKCDCHGTGFYGHRCEHKCSKHLSRDNLLTEACLF